MTENARSAFSSMGIRAVYRHAKIYIKYILTDWREIGYLIDMKHSHCECSDPGCPAHMGKSECTRNAVSVVRRVDMEDGNTKLAMCRACAEDALSSGVFA